MVNIGENRFFKISLSPKRNSHKVSFKFLENFVLVDFRKNNPTDVPFRKFASKKKIGLNFKIKRVGFSNNNKKR